MITPYIRVQDRAIKSTGITAVFEKCLRDAEVDICVNLGQMMFGNTPGVDWERVRAVGYVVGHDQLYGPNDDILPSRP